MTYTLRLRPPLLAVLLLPLFLAGCSSLYGPGVSVSHTTGQNTPLVSEDSDSDDALGAREHPKIVASHGGVYSDRPAEIMLARVVGRLLKAAGQPDTRFTLTILDTAEVNAFALPGGYIYVTRGLLALANDTSEIAAVLSHEIAHVTLKHARARINRVRTSQIVDQVVTDVFGGDVETDQSANRSKLALAAFSQAQELAADKQGILTTGHAGYDPQAAARFLGIMSRFSQFSVGDVEQADDFLSSHPSTPDRIQKAIETARSFFDRPGLGETDRDGYLDAVDGLAFGDSASQGTVVGQRYVNAVLGLTFTVPDRYSLQVSNGAVVGVAGENEAVRFDSADVPASTGLEDYLKSGWIAGLQPETVRPENANGVEMATGVAVTPQWTFRVAVARIGDKVYRFIFAARFDSPAFEAAATATLRSFRAATPRDSEGVKHLVLRLVKAGTLDTADSLARGMSGLTRGTDLFYILNNLYPGDPVVPGPRYKVVAVE
jgi:predicted Zn-dependent protease